MSCVVQAGDASGRTDRSNQWKDAVIGAET